MLFDIAPKERVEDLYDMRRELSSLEGFLSDPYVRMVVILGPRRTGKTSLLRVALNELGYPRLYVDARRVLGSREYFVREVKRGLEEMLSARRHRRLLLKALERVKGISVGGVRVELEARDFKATVVDVLESVDRELGGGFFILALDEAQELSAIRWLPKVLAYCYDTLRRVKVVVTGSEIRVLEDFLGEGDPESPLFGRPYAAVRTRRLSREEAIGFLEAGFMEVGMSIEEAVLREAVDRLDGVIGWLTYFGWHAWKCGDLRRGLEEAVLRGSMLSRSELERFLARREEARARYIAILKAASVRPLSWSQISRYLMAELGRRIAPNQLARYLSSLVRYGFLEKAEGKYYVSDPLLREALEHFTS